MKKSGFDNTSSRRGKDTGGGVAARNWPRDPAAAPDVVRPSFDGNDWPRDVEPMTVDMIPESIAQPPTLRIDLPKGHSGVSPRPAKVDAANGVLPVLSFTKLELPTFDTFETAVAFEPETDPLTAHDAMAPLFGQKAGQGKFLFCADSAVSGRYWVRSVSPWEHMPVLAVTALEPKRVGVQLAPGLMHHFSVPVCVGKETVRDGRKHVQPFATDREYLAWFDLNAIDFGIKTLMACADLRTLRFRHGDAAYRIEYAVIEGALEVVDPDLLLQRLLRGFGAHRRLGLGMMKLSG